MEVTLGRTVFLTKKKKVQLLHFIPVRYRFTQMMMD